MGIDRYRPHEDKRPAIRAYDYIIYFPNTAAGNAGLRVLRTRYVSPLCLACNPSFDLKYLDRCPDCKYHG